MIHAVGDGFGAKREVLSNECFVGGPLYPFNSLGNQDALSGGGKEFPKWAEVASIEINKVECTSSKGVKDDQDLGKKEGGDKIKWKDDSDKIATKLRKLDSSVIMETRRPLRRQRLQELHGM